LPKRFFVALLIICGLDARQLLARGGVTAFVPHYAMSGGTLIALAANETVMCQQSILGPIDPQVGSFPAASLTVALLKLGQRVATIDLDSRQQIRSQCCKHGERAQTAKQAHRRQNRRRSSLSNRAQARQTSGSGVDHKYGCPLHGHGRVLIGSLQAVSISGSPGYPPGTERLKSAVP
jgi:hypothetical protein